MPADSNDPLRAHRVDGTVTLQTNDAVVDVVERGNQHSLVVVRFRGHTIYIGAADDPDGGAQEIEINVCQEGRKGDPPPCRFTVSVNDGEVFASVDGTTIEPLDALEVRS